MNQIEKEFIERINQKQVGVYRDLFRMFYRYLVLYAMRYVQLQEPAEDIVPVSYTHLTLPTIEP